VHKPGLEFPEDELGTKSISAPCVFCSLANASPACFPVTPVDGPGVRLPAHVGSSACFESFLVAFDVEFPMTRCKGNGRPIPSLYAAKHLEKNFCSDKYFFFFVVDVHMLVQIQSTYRVRRASLEATLHPAKLNPRPNPSPCLLGSEKLSNNSKSIFYDRRYYSRIFVVQKYEAYEGKEKLR